MRPRLLSVSNGHGEDIIASAIVRHLREAEVVAFPLVGLGEAYPPDLPRLEPRRVFPSGGFGLRHGLPSLLDDLRSGIVRFWLTQRRTLAALRGGVTLTLAVGDLYCLGMAALAGAPVVLVASADSVLNVPYGGLQLRQLRQRARRVYTRDEPTARYLSAHAIPAAHLGNVMMDCLDGDGAAPDLPSDRPIVTLLPGSRGEAPVNAGLLTQMAARVARARPEAIFLLSLAPSVEERAVGEAVRQAGGAPDGMAFASGGTRLIMTRAFADAVARATVVVGLAGTANEQAAGLGKPVVAFPGPGPQFTRGFLDLQRKILGEALIAASSPEEAAGVVLHLLDAPEERVRRGQAGRERMGSPGAARRIASDIETVLREVGG